MYLSTCYDIIERLTTWVLIIPDLEMIKLKLNRWDRGLIEECKKSEKLSDKLLALGEIVGNLEMNSIETG